LTVCYFSKCEKMELNHLLERIKNVVEQYSCLLPASETIFRLKL
jgi:hypothetical protein